MARKYNQEWNHRFSNVDSFNAYAIENEGVVHLKNLKLENYKLNGLQAKVLIIENSSLNKIEAHKSRIGKLIIKNSDLNEVFMHYATIKEFIVENSDLEYVELGSKGIKNTVIKESSLFKSDIEIESEKILITDTFIKRSTFTRSIFKTLKITNTKFDESKLNYFGSTKIDSLLIKDSSLNVSFRGSKIKEVVLENVSGRYVDFLGVKGNKVTISNSDVNGFILGGTRKMNSFESVNSRIEEFSMNSLKIKKISIKNCLRKTGISFMESIIEEVDIDNCDFRKSMFIEAKIGKMSIKNSEITSDHWIVGGWEKMRIEELTLENVLIDGIFRMQNAYIGTLKTKNFRKGRNLDIDYTGTNFKF